MELTFINRNPKNPNTTHSNIVAIYNNVRIFTIEFEPPSLSRAGFYWLQPLLFGYYLHDKDMQIIDMSEYKGKQYENLQDIKNIANKIFNIFMNNLLNINENNS